MARYWVGGTANWDGTAGTKWALTSGGAGGQAVPGSSDDVLLDANSGSVTITITATANCANLTCTGFTGTLTGSSAINIYGSMLLVTTMTWSISGLTTMKSTSTGKTMNSAGFNMTGSVTFDGVGGGWSVTNDVANDFRATTFTLTNGSFDCSAFLISGGDVRCTTFDISNTNTRTLVIDGIGDLGNSGGRLRCKNWTATTITGLTFTSGNSCVTIDAASGTFAGGGLTYKDMLLFGNVFPAVTIVGNNTFRTIAIQDGAAMKFTAGSNNTITGDFILINPSIASGFDLTSSSPGNTYTLTKTLGFVLVRYSRIRDCIATGGATWQASDSIDQGNNTGWIFLNISQGGLRAKRATGGFLTSSQDPTKLRAKRATGGFLKGSAKKL